MIRGLYPILDTTACQPAGRGFLLYRLPTGRARLSTFDFCLLPFDF